MVLKFDESGLQTESLAEIKEKLREDYRISFGASFNLDESSITGKEIGILAENLALIQEAIQGVYSSGSRTTASGVSLDREGELLNLARKPATFSSATVYVRGTPDTLVNANQLKATVDGTNDTFQNGDSFTIGSLPSESIDTLTQTGGIATATISGGHSFAESSYVFIRGADQEGYNLLAQISNVTSTTFDYSVDNSTVSPSTGSATAYQATPVNFLALVTGPINAFAGTLTQIVGTVVGVDEIENASDATLGSEVETDAQYRQRLDDSIGVTGGGHREAILASIRGVSGVQSQVVYENVEGFTDSDGRPAHSVECFVEGGSDADIAQAIYDTVSAGIRTFGNVTEVITDSEGESVNISFSRLVIVEIYVDVTLTVNTDIQQGPVYPVDGDDQVKQALSSINFSPNFDVWETSLRSAVLSINGVISVDSLFFDKTASPANTSSIVILPTERANIDSSNVTVSS
jgi:uncharacterized phage protein gp47/JayE